MLRIKKEVDLKELEKFGYKKGIVYCFGECYVKELEYDDFIFITNDKTILFEINSFDVEKEIFKQALIIQDLIQAKFIEEDK